MGRLALILTLLLMAEITTADAAETIPIWKGPAPESHGTGENDVPTLTLFLPKDAKAPVPAMIVFPGGGYEHLAGAYEGANLAEYFQQKGCAGFVVKYRLPSKGYRHPVPLIDARRVVRLVRSRAKEWNINPSKIGVLGFSAGGHLVSTLETHFDAGSDLAEDPIDRVSSRPDFVVLAYPVITFKTPGVTHEGSKKNLLGDNPDPALVENLSNETQVTTQTPPTVLVHAEDDKSVPIENSRLMLAALQKAGVPAELQVYPHGGHGFGFGPGPRQELTPAGWLDKVYLWLQKNGFKA